MSSRNDAEITPTDAELVAELQHQVKYGALGSREVRLIIGRFAAATAEWDKARHIATLQQQALAEAMEARDRARGEAVKLRAACEAAGRYIQGIDFIAPELRHCRDRAVLSELTAALAAPDPRPAATAIRFDRLPIEAVFCVETNPFLWRKISPFAAAPKVSGIGGVPSNFDGSTLCRPAATGDGQTAPPDSGEGE